MRRSLPVLLCATLVLTGCARIQESQLNPLNWFAASTPVTRVDADGKRVPLVPPRAQIVDTRVLIGQIRAMSINRTPDGAIVTASGIATTQGQFNAQLVPVSVANGVLTLAFRVETPAGKQDVGPTSSRQITVARVLDQAALAGIRTIRVEAAQNARSLRR